MKAPAVMLGLAAMGALAGCGDRPLPEVDVRPESEASTAACVDRFVQVFEESTPDVPPQDLQNACFDTTPPAGPPRFPSQSRKVRLEYDRGDYYAVQESVSWWLGDPDLARGCSVIPRLKHERVVVRVQGGVKESMKVEDGETVRSSETGEQYSGRIALGAGPGAMPTALLPSPQNPTPEVLREESPFGTCLRASTVHDASLCTLEQARECRSSKVMLPIEMRIPNGLGGGTQIGRTTSLERVTPNQSEWVLQ